MLTPESFAEHRSGLKDQEITGNGCFYLSLFFTLLAQANKLLISPRDQVKNFSYVPFCSVLLESAVTFSDLCLLLLYSLAAPLSFHVCILFSPFIHPYLLSSLSSLSGAGCVPEDEAYIPTYLEAFPPLPEKGAPGEKAGEPAPAWGSKIRPIKASVITQVSQLPTTHTDTPA